MNTSKIFILLGAFFCTSFFVIGQAPLSSSSSPQTPQPTSYAVTKRSANANVWERTVYEKAPDGTVIPKKHSYQELATGLNFLDKKTGQWTPSKEEIDLLPAGGEFAASATAGQHQAYFPSDIYNGEIRMVTPEGKVLRSRPVGLFYDDGNNTVMIAELTNSVGELVGDNEVVYPNAFAGLNADLRYTYTKAGFEQDIVLREQPLTPESYGLNADTAKLQVLTEFFNPPQPTVSRSTTLPAQAGLALADDSLGFGTMQMIQGRAFLMGQNAKEAGAMVAKQWVQLEGRQFLAEEVPVNAIVDKLAALPLTAMNSGKPAKMASSHLTLPPQRLAKRDISKTMMLAKAEPSNHGFVLDYQTINSSLTNYTFQGDTTYYISGTVNLYGTNTFEGGAVIKYATNATILEAPGGFMQSSNGLHWCGDSYRPVVFTAKDDNTVGETISGSTGSPTGYYGDPSMLQLVNFIQISIDDLRMSYARTAIQFSSGNGKIYNAQFINCQNGIYLFGASVLLGNALFVDTKTNVILYPFASATVENATFSHSVFLVSGQTGSSVSLINCILSYVTNLASGTLAATNLDYDGFYQSPYPVDAGHPILSDANPFQTIGGGNYYLTNGCDFFNAGTADIDPALLAELAQKTTCPPMVYSNVVITTNTTLSPQAIRDTNDAPDLGYHYDPVDYFFGGVEVQSNLTFTAGTAVGWFYNWSGNGYGLTIGDSATVAFNGTATAPCIFARYNTVQEGGNGNWTYQGWLSGITGQSYVNAAPVAQGQFLKAYMLNSEGLIMRDYWTLLVQNFNDSEFYDSGVGGYYSSANYTNCLFFRGGVGLWWNWDSANITLWNCTFFGGNLTADHDSSGDWPLTIVNCTFDATTSYLNPHSNSTNGAYCDYNAFSTNTSRLYYQGAHDVIVTNFNWQSSWLGDFYLPTDSPLIDAGSTTADQLGLYHFTTQTNQIKETNSIVDIGYHDIATDQYGNPLDTDGDGTSDYIEDPNGNGMMDAGETSWTNWDTDGDGFSDSEEMADGTDPLNVDSAPGLLGRWYFDDTNWFGAQGQTPLAATNLQLVPSWSSNAMELDTDDGSLTYNMVEGNGHTNLNLQCGTVRFWFCPDWNSVDQAQNESDWPALIESTATNVDDSGFWGLYLYPDGTDLYLEFDSEDEAGDWSESLLSPVDWNSNQWHQITMTYTPTNSALYVDGVLVASAGGITFFPSFNQFTIGNDIYDDPAYGQFDELDTFDYPLSAERIAADYNKAINQDSDNSGMPDIWEMENFAHLGVDPNADPDGDGYDNLIEYQVGFDPNVFNTNAITFSFSVPDQYVTTNIIRGVATILDGVPFYYAVLVDSTNFSTATWSAYDSSNITINLGSTEGAHDVWIGLRGLPSNAQQTWEETTLILETNPPAISITNPADNSSFDLSAINVSGSFSSGALHQITVNGVSAFVNGTNFNALNVPLTAGTNIITAVVEDLTGATNAVSITVIGLTNSDGSMNIPVQLQATPIAGFSPLTVTLNVVSNNATGTFQQALYDFNGDGITDFVTNNLDSVTTTYTNGEYFPTVTIQTDQGLFSSSGGWNSYDPNRLQITVQNPATLLQTISVTDPVDLKWDGTNLYVLSGSSGTITEFDTNGTSVGTLVDMEASCSGFDMDSAGDIYVAVTASNQVWKFNPYQFHGDDIVFGGYGFFDEEDSGETFYADSNFGNGGYIGLTNGMSGTNDGEFNAPYDVAVSPDGGTISVSDSGNDRIQQFDSDGNFKDSFGSFGSGIGQFNTPKGLTYDSVGTLYIADSGNGRIVLAQGNFVEAMTGTNGTALGQFDDLANISVDERGVYVADIGNNRVQSFSPPVHNSLFSIDPSSIRFAISSSLNAPAAVAAVYNLTNDMFYVADTGNNQVLLYGVAVDNPTPTWANLTTCATNGDIDGVLANFSVASVDDYRQAFLSIGASDAISALNKMGTLMPVYINSDRAEYYFTNTINGQNILFPVEFDKENGVWKILSF